MRRDERNIGAREGLLDEKHRRAMGPARHLYDWLLARQTTERNGVGLVLGGAPLGYARIVAETGWPRRTIQRWMARLVEKQYVQVSHVDRNRLMVAILRAKKFVRPKAPIARLEGCAIPVQKAVNFGGNPVQQTRAGAPKVAHLDAPKVAELNSLVLMCGKKELREKESQKQEPTAATAVPAPAVEKQPARPAAKSGAEMAQCFAAEAEAGRGEFLAALHRLARTHSLPRLTLSPRQFAARQQLLERQRAELLDRSPPVEAGAA